ncbi:MAG: DNA helicase RecQ [Methanosarcinaceae archaeon]|nr:DNA helicase RecQ [Methanosarcinaceae archaeon]MDF1533920.1 DNA helicase RecQ [Methanosarcinaceae archaeon]
MHKTLQKYFGYTLFRPLQEDIINDVLSGKDTFVLMPTGGGKSLCFQLPALLMDGMTIVVSPLISLMKDQVDSLVANGIEAVYLNSTLSYSEIKGIKASIVANRVKILYVAPERLMMTETLGLLKSVNVSLFAIDEAHCISEWGHDFRPEYRKLKTLRGKFPSVPIIALTATATPKVRNDIVSELKFKGHNTYVASFDRKNLFYRIKPKNDTYGHLLQYLRETRGKSGIIYCQSRKTVDTLSKKLKKAGFSSLPYHAGLTDKVRTKNQEMFIKDDVQIIVATVAFGMGIDKPNVRFVVHYDLPKNLESYYQETGRGGRDGLECDCILFFGHGDRYKIEYFINKMGKKQERDIALVQLREMIDYCEANSCRRKVLLKYFGEEVEEDNCGNCDVCLEPKEMFDGTEAAKKLLLCVEDLDQRFGMTHVIDVLVGAKTKKIINSRHSMLKSYSAGREYSKSQWQSIARELVRLEVLGVEGTKYPLLKLNPKSMAVLGDSEFVQITKPADEVKISVKGSCAATTKTSKSKSLSRAASKSTPKAKTKSSSKSKSTATKTINATDSELFERLRVLRKTLANRANLPPYIIFADTSLRQMAAKRPTTAQDFLEITGVAEHKLEKYGGTFLAEIADFCDNDEKPTQSNDQTKPKSEKPVKRPPKISEILKNRAVNPDVLSSSVIETLELYKQHMSVEEIAHIRNLTQSTIAEHMEILVQSKRIDSIDHMVDPDKKCIIENAINDVGDKFLSRIKAKLGDDYSYGEIKLVRAAMMCE